MKDLSRLLRFATLIDLIELALLIPILVFLGLFLFGCATIQFVGQDMEKHTITFCGNQYVEPSDIDTYIQDTYGKHTGNPIVTTSCERKVIGASTVSWGSNNIVKPLYGWCCSYKVEG